MFFSFSKFLQRICHLLDVHCEYRPSLSQKHEWDCQKIKEVVKAISVLNTGQVKQGVDEMMVLVVRYHSWVLILVQKICFSCSGDSWSGSTEDLKVGWGT